MSGERWIDDEPTVGQTVRYVAWRARRRWWLALAVALLATLAIVVTRKLRPPNYVATAVIRINEGYTTSATPSPPGALRNHLASRALSRSGIATIMRKYRQGDPDSSASVELFRDRIDIGVKQNYFLEDGEGGPRSALVTLEFGAGDPALARGVVHDLAASISSSQEALRRRRLVNGRATFADAMAIAREAVRQIEVEEGQLAAQLAHKSPFDLAFDARMAYLRQRRSNAQLRLVQLEQRAQEIDLAIVAESYGAGMTFEIVDEELDTFSAVLDVKGMVRLGLTWLVVIAPLAALLVGAFNRRVYGREDLVHIGVPIVGVLPVFPGDRVGSLHERTRRKRV